MGKGQGTYLTYATLPPLDISLCEMHLFEEEGTCCLILLACVCAGVSEAAV